LGPEGSEKQGADWIVNQPAIVSNVDRLLEKAELCVITSKEFPAETMHGTGDRHEDGVMDMNIGHLHGCDRLIDGEAIV
jgi:hypothetical protein